MTLIVTSLQCVNSMAVDALATIRVLFSQRLFRPYRTKASPESYYHYVSIALCILCINCGRSCEFDLYFEQYYTVTKSQQITQALLTVASPFSFYPTVLNTTVKWDHLLCLLSSHFIIVWTVNICISTFGIMCYKVMLKMFWQMRSLGKLIPDYTIAFILRQVKTSVYWKKPDTRNLERNRRGQTLNPAPGQIKRVIPTVSRYDFQGIDRSGIIKWSLNVYL